MMDEGQPGGAHQVAPSSGVRPLEGWTSREATRFGPEMGALVQLEEAGLPVAAGYLVRLSDDPIERLAEALRRVLGAAPVARMRPLFPSADARERFGQRVGLPEDVTTDDDANACAARFMADLRGVLGMDALAVGVRVLGCEREPCGGAVSADADRGDPDEIGVWARGEPASRWRIDRRTLRVTQRGGGMSPMEASAVADLADRAQLALGRPVEIEWGAHGRRFVVVGVRDHAVTPSVGVGMWRRVALVAADEGTVAGLAVDALGTALGGEAGTVEPVVRRIFARPYRRMDASVPRFRRVGAAASVVRAGARAARVASDVAAPLAAAGAFHRTVRERLRVLDAMSPHTLSDRSLMETIRERFALVAEAFAWLDRGRAATGAALAALEAVAGPLPPGIITVLAAPRPTRTRVRQRAALARLARDVAEAHDGVVVPPEELLGGLRRRFAELRHGLRNERELGIDVRQDALGADDARLHAALQAALEQEGFPSDRARREVARQVVTRTATRPFGGAREVLAAPLLLLLGRVAQAKGAVADDLAASLLRLRRAARVAGARLVDRGVLEVPDDALQLTLDELEQALSGEPGAYAARARLRREDDARWARFEAPRRLEGRATADD